MTDTVPSPGGLDQPPVLLLGGSENAVSCARRFTGAGIPTVVVNKDSAPALRSRGVIPEGLGADFDGPILARWLANEGAERWAGAVLLPLSDRALLGIVDQQAELSKVFKPALFSPTVVEAMLDKQKTIELAMAAGVGTPRQWTVLDGTLDEVGLPADLAFPLILKPRRNFELISRTGRKYLRADDVEQLLNQLPTMYELPSGFVLNEFIPGGDETLSSYYAVRTTDGEILMEFTKRVDRRYPTNQGGATFHELCDLPATAVAGRKFFEHVGLVGVGNVEFKQDPRSGELKIIECNHRLTAATSLMQDNGLDLAGAVYDQALGRPLLATSTPKWGATMWYPIRDLRSFRQEGVGLSPWLKRPKRSTYPYFRWSDPGPSLAVWGRTVSASVRARLQR